MRTGPCGSLSSKKTFLEDLMFQETDDDKNFQARYVLNHPWKRAGVERRSGKCERQIREYFSDLFERQEKSAQNLASLTGWDINEIRKKMKGDSSDNKKKEDWWKGLWEKKGDKVLNNSKDKKEKKKSWWSRLWNRKK